MLELYKTFHQPIWTIALFIALYFPIKKILYKINNKTKVKNFNINGEVFGLNFKSEWERDYTKPAKILHNIDIIYPKVEIKWS